MFLPRGVGAATNRKRWKDMTETERREFPGDWEAQVGQGAITFHSDEHLASSDEGIVMLRRVLHREVNAVARGEDPPGISFDPAAPPVVFEAGNRVVDG